MTGNSSSGRRRTVNSGYVEDALSMDIRGLRDIGVLPLVGSCSGSLVWGAGDRAVASVGFYLGFRSQLRATLSLVFSVEGEVRQQQVAIEAFPCRLGGQRYYFVCPKELCRCDKLYFAGDSWASRQAHRLTYRAQSLAQWRQAIRIEHKAKCRALGLEGYAEPRGVNKVRLRNRWQSASITAETQFLERFAGEIQRPSLGL